MPNVKVWWVSLKFKNIRHIECNVACSWKSKLLFHFFNRWCLYLALLLAMVSKLITNPGMRRRPLHLMQSSIKSNMPKLGSIYVLVWIPLASASMFTSMSEIVIKIRNCHNHKLRTNPWHREKEPHNNHETPERQTKQSNQLSLPIEVIAKLEWT